MFIYLINVWYNAISLYTSVGFMETGHIKDGEMVARFEL